MTLPPPDAPTFLLALYGAVLGTIGTIISVILAANELRKGRRSIRISCAETEIGPLILFAGDDRPIEYSPGLRIKVLNNGPRPVEVQIIGVRVAPDVVIGADVAARSNPLPKKLEFSDSITLEFHVTEIAKRIPAASPPFHRFKAAVQDAEDRWYSAPLPRAVIAQLAKHKPRA